ncbi:hypothetical protein LPC08_22295 [Roseomonas sp. OT10]|uniref:hypothetical protein n=1 Tax=Roseomonas cutis TaxID=2897332 RepID=UPI001E41F53A|nr:hypothetical protein [Roseomonas sp. OT10]UFN48708.1 hypothetical protein LPC08_22295 [Roseomonas sp. OT10]
MTLRHKILAAALLATAAFGQGAMAQGSAAYNQALLAELSPEKRAEVQGRATQGNSVQEVLEVILLNNIKLRYPANRIVALDFGRGTAVVELPEGNAMRIVTFNKSTLEIQG